MKGNIDTKLLTTGANSRPASSTAILTVSCEDSQGHIYVHHTVNASSESHDTMVIFDAKGKFIKSWGKEFKGGAHGLHIAKEGKDEFFTCATPSAPGREDDAQRRRSVHARLPERVRRIQAGRGRKQEEIQPTNLASRRTATSMSATDTGPATSTSTTRAGKYIRTFGGRGRSRDKFRCPHGLIVDTRGTQPVLTVADRTNKRLQHFTLDGKHIAFGEGVSRRAISMSQRARWSFRIWMPASR